MLSKQALISSLLLFSLLLVARSETDPREARFTIQVAAFPESEPSDKFIARLEEAGEQPVWGTIELPNRGLWVRVFIGLFETSSAARAYGAGLVTRGIIKEFLVKPASEMKALGRPRSVGGTATEIFPYIAHPALASDSLTSSLPLALDPPVTTPTAPDSLPVSMLAGFLKEIETSLVPTTDTTLISRGDPVRLAFKLIVREGRARDASHQSQGGLWVAGDTAEALARLRWIVGHNNADSINIDDSGQVQLETGLLAQMVGINDATSPAAAFAVANYITSNEGLLLLVQVTQSRRRYRLHIGAEALTLGSAVVVNGSLNLDNNFDSRINPYRRSGQKLNHERPPQGFDSLIAINPGAHWFNLHARRFVPAGHITFHELAEAHAKLELELDYLAQGSRPGAHNVALERERRLKLQRPFSDVVVTIGSNRVLRSQQELRRFYAESGLERENQR